MRINDMRAYGTGLAAERFSADVPHSAGRPVALVGVSIPNCEAAGRKAVLGFVFMFAHPFTRLVDIAKSWYPPGPGRSLRV